jgi:integrase
MELNVRNALRWIQGHVPNVSALSNPEILRAALDRLAVRLDGRMGAPSVVSRHRRIFNTAIEYAVELKILAANPIPKLKWTVPKVSMAVDRRSVANPVQARTLLNAVREGRNGARLVAFFGCLYFAALRPEEAAALRKRNLSLPREGGASCIWIALSLTLVGSGPTAARTATTGSSKQRAVGEGPIVPCPPELTALLQEHIGRFGFGMMAGCSVGREIGRSFRGERSTGPWKEARRAAFTPEVCESPLAATPYDLRHAAVSTWLNGGVPRLTSRVGPGHSVEICSRSTRSASTARRPS